MELTSPFPSVSRMECVNPFSSAGAWLFKEADVDVTDVEGVSIAESLVNLHSALSHTLCQLKSQVEDEFDGTVAFHSSTAVQAMMLLVDAATRLLRPALSCVSFLPGQRPGLRKGGSSL